MNAVLGTMVQPANVPSAYAQPSSGDGSSGNPYKIGTCKMNCGGLRQVNAGNSGLCATLTADIKVNGDIQLLDDNGALAVDSVVECMDAYW